MLEKMAYCKVAIFIHCISGAVPINPQNVYSDACKLGLAV